MIVLNEMKWKMVFLLCATHQFFILCFVFIVLIIFFLRFFFSEQTLSSIMSESLPITTAPKRRLDHHPSFAFSHLSESCKNTPNLTRKLEPYHHALLESGCQSAKSSPLPHRRLDKLEGVIRDKPSPISLRKHIDADDGGVSSAESSPSVFRKFNNKTEPLPAPCRRHELSYNNGRRNTDCGCANSNLENNTPMMRRRVDSDCTCTRKITLAKQLSNAENMSKSECMCSSPLMPKKNVFSSPAKSVMGEPGCFSSPIHRAGEHGSSFTNFGSPAKSLLGEPGVFASPARSMCISPCDENLDAETVLQPDQTVISGWLKFRDNKRVSESLIHF